MVGVVALLVAAASYGIVQSQSNLVGNKSATESTVASMDQSTAAGSASEESFAATTTASGATTTTAAASATDTSIVTMMPAATQDREEMISSLRASESPAYFVFGEADSAGQGDNQSGETTRTVVGETTSTEVAALSTAEVEALVSQITSLTGLEPLDGSLNLESPTFAAYISRDDAALLVDLMHSIGTSLQLTVSLGTEPPEKLAGLVAQLAELKARLPVLITESIPQSASGYAFTTSTWISASGATENGTELATPDEAETHILIVVCVQG